MKVKKASGLSGSHLKLIALCSMLIDHIGAILLENGLLPQIASSVLAGSSFNYLPADYQFWHHVNLFLRLIGRLAFPIYCFLLVEGFLHTKSVAKYALRLALFAFISEVPFDLALFHTAFDLGMQNVYFTLLIGIIVLWQMKALEDLPPNLAPLRYLVALTGMLLAEFLQTDYSAFGVLLIVLLYILRQNRKHQCIAGAVSTSWEYTAPIAFAIAYFYNGERGKQFPKYMFYAFYPLHLLILVGLRSILL